MRAPGPDGGPALVLHLPALPGPEGARGQQRMAEGLPGEDAEVPEVPREDRSGEQAVAG